MRKKAQHIGLELSGNDIVGKDPRKMTVEDLNAMGHEKMPLGKAIRKLCIECSGGSESEVRRCTTVSCPVWPYRMGKNPFAKRDLTDEQRAEMAKRLRKEN